MALLTRSRALAALAVVAPLLLGPPAAAQSAPTPKTRVYVVVIDGLRPDEITPVEMPFLDSLAQSGTYYTEARSVMVAETIPNHVAMVTGAYPDKNGIVANNFPVVGADDSDIAGGTNESLEAGDPRLLRADSVFTTIQQQCPQLQAEVVNSKDYLQTIMSHDRTGDGQVDADYVFDAINDPAFIPGLGLTPDERTLQVARFRSEQTDPDFLFVNLGSVDRVGHIDLTGGVTSPLPTGSEPAARRAQRLATDTELRAFVQSLRDRGIYESTKLIITADHSMDWSLPNRFVSLSPGIAADPLLAGQFVVAQNGGAGLYSLKDRQDPRAGARLAGLRALALAQAGADEALYRLPNPVDGGDEHAVGRAHPDWHQTGDRSGDLLLTVQDGYRVTEPSPGTSNPIPGNHGMASTLRIPLIVTGGSGVKAQRPAAASADPDVRSPGQAENVDIAPTVSWLLGVEPPAAGFDGRALSEAFPARPADSCVARSAGPAPVVPDSSLPIVLPVAAATALALVTRTTVRRRPAA